ncbi:Carbohydrate-responsive element-binding protein [Stylophora pistillata]|uniref:Carbohydrate-responsive element-binding protein n=2 Tax=Stylophora pistillata TaxID=50429 RepID=A0A2B4RLR6_STYPI|nr:Carbohydrate-responsive element-binding protein [Stylophora pistillata]
MIMDSRYTSLGELGQSTSFYTAHNRDTSQAYDPYRKRTSITLDENLSRLFECMRLEYGTGGFLISPKWKNFRSQKLQFAEKTRLNNAIWRCWHIQYSKGKRPLFCQFVNPLSEEKEPFKKKPFAVILEGRYWRRKLEAVAREYKKLRIYYKKWSNSPVNTSPLSHLSLRAQQIDQEIAQKLEEKERKRKRTISSDSGDDNFFTTTAAPGSDAQVDHMLNIMDTAFNDDLALSALPDTLFTSRQTNFGGAVIPQEGLQQQPLTYRAREAPDVFQVPTLDSLQPNLDEFMEHFETLTGMLVKQGEHAGNQPNYVQQSDYNQCQAVAPPPPNATVYVNQGDPYEATAPGQDEVMDHSGAYESVAQEMFPTQTVDNSQLRQEVMQPDGQVLMDISSANSTVDFSYNYGNVLQGGSFTSQLDQSRHVHAQSQSVHAQNKQQVVTSPRLASPVEQPQLPPYPTSPPQHHQTPLEEIQIQAQQHQSRGNNVMSPTNQFVGNVDPFNTARQMDDSNQQRKGRLPRNVSDTQLYTMDLSQLGTSFHTNLFPSMESNLPPQLEAPNLAAHLQSIQPRTRIPSLPTTSNPKRPRLPRNMSDSKLSSLARMCRSPTSPPSLPTVPSSEIGNQPSQIANQPSQIANQPSHPIANPPHPSGRKKRGGFPRIMSDSSLLSLGQQPHQRAPPAPAAAPITSQRRRKMSTPEHLGNTVAALSSQSPTFTSTADTPQLTGSLTTNANLLEQLLLAPVASQAPAAESYQTNNSVLGQLLTQPSPSNPAVPMQTRETGTVSGTQDPSLLNQLYQLKQVLHKQSAPTELVNALSTLSNTGATQATQHKQEQPQAVQHKTAPMQPSLQMKPQNQNVITQALQSLLRAPPNVAIQPSTSSKPTTPVSNFTSQSPLQAALITSNSAPVPTVTIKHTPQNKVPVPAVNQNVLPQAAVILSPQGNLQAVQDTPTGHMSGVPEVPTSCMPQVVNVGHPTVQGHRIILPANVNLSTLSLAQLGLSPATLQSVTVPVPSSAVNSSSPLQTVATMSAGAKNPLAVTVSTAGLVTESQDTGGMRPTKTPPPAKQTRPVTAEQREQYKEHRRISHITAEQKRRGNIKMGFDQLMSLVPSLASQRNSKVSKATVLQKTVEYTTKLQRERQTMQEEAELLRKQIQDLNASISMCQQQLPATGVPVARQRVDQMWSMFNQYVKTRTQDNFKFWIFSVLMRHLFEEYNNTVSTASVEDFCRTVIAWLEQHCSLPALRPAALSSLRDLSKATSILSDPSKVPEQALRATANRDPTDLSAMIAPPGANGGVRNGGAAAGYS